MVQLPMFAIPLGQKTSRSGGVPTPPLESQTLPQEGWGLVEENKVLDPLDVLGLDPLLIDVSADATGIMAGPAWSAVFATQNLLDTLGFGFAAKLDVYEQHLFNVIWRARLELDLVGHPEHEVLFYYHTDRADLRLALVIRADFQPPAAVIGLVEDF